MATKKAAPKQKAVSPEKVRDKNPVLTVQISEARMLRKEILESVREVIIFMQGYERFRKLQEDKVALFAKLRLQLRDINRLIDSGLRKDLPQGKLRPLSKLAMPEKPRAQEMPLERAPSPAPAEMPSSEQQVRSGLDELEAQLQDIENQLRKVA